MNLYCRIIVVALFPSLYCKCGPNGIPYSAYRVAGTYALNVLVAASRRAQSGYGFDQEFNRCEAMFPSKEITMR